jgi:hypothetical protein
MRMVTNGWILLRGEHVVKRIRSSELLVLVLLKRTDESALTKQFF